MEAIEREAKQCDLGLIGLDQMSLVPYQEIQGDTMGLKVGMRARMTSWLLITERCLAGEDETSFSLVSRGSKSLLER